MPGDSAAVAHGMQTVAKQVKADPAVLLGLPVVKDVFDTCLDTRSSGVLRMCATCRTLGCRECRKHLAGEAALSSDEETGV